MKEYIRLLRLLKPYKWLLVLAFILTLLYSVTNAISVYLSIPLLRTLFLSNNPQNLAPPNQFNNIFDSFRYAFDAYIFSDTDKVNILAKVCVLLMLFFFSKNLFGYLQSILTQYVQKSMTTSIRRRMYQKFTTLSLKYFSEKRSGDVISRFISDVNLLQSSISVSFTNIIKEPMLIIIFLVMAFFISWKLTLISIVIVPIALILIIYIGRKLRKYSYRVQDKLSEFTSVIAETIYGSKIIRAFSMENFENRKFEKKLRSYFRVQMKHAIYNNLSSPMTEFLSVAVGVFIIWYGGREIFQGGGLAPEEFLGFLIIIFQLMTPIKDLSSVNNMIQESATAAVRIFDILDTEPEIFDKKNAVTLKDFNNAIEFRNVSFFYEEDRLILNDVSLKINKMEKVAIVGLSGVGKSTFVDLIPRFYDVTSGEVLIDGINIKDIKLDSLRNLFGIVTQEIILFNDTIKNNIAYGYEDIPMEKIIEAAINANAHEFILETEKGYDTLIGERGIKLSGGQKQRIAIARALLKNAPIMIFDEATSSLDTESENLIQEAIERLVKNNTSIIIAHRLSTIRDADRIIVLHDGHIENIGTHDELMEDEDSIYKKLYELQFS
ncbi:MAG: ABC transporter ATP-binding protein [Ignavibacteriae bacterium]|nr:MAG: ABC transporter ATP-binding protein [Ignavibacteriota bacterium]